MALVKTECGNCKRVVTINDDHPAPLCPKCGHLAHAEIPIPADLQRFANHSGLPALSTFVVVILWIAAIGSGFGTVTALLQAKSAIHEILACLAAMTCLGCLFGVAVLSVLQSIANRGNE